MSLRHPGPRHRRPVPPRAAATCLAQRQQTGHSPATPWTAAASTGPRRSREHDDPGRDRGPGQW